MRLLRERKWADVVEPTATVLFSDGFILKAVPRGQKAQGVPTAFSRFTEFGVEYIPQHDYYVYPPTEIKPDKVLVHALLASRTNQERSMCAVFYLINRKNRHT